jgi:oligopeptide/dipeptide ABC transporter ATP-binding protein
MPDTPKPTRPLVEVNNLKKYFPIKKGILSRTVGHVKAVDDVSFHVGHGETLGLVGESGCGKTTVGRSILRLIEPSAGEVLFEGQDVLGLSGSALRAARRSMQIIFQDPYSSLNPRMTVEGIVGEALTVHGIAKGAERRKRVEDLLVRVGLSKRHIGRYPHEFSGGQRQRIGIARALALAPKFIVCDEPVSALDVSIQAQILNLLMDLQKELGLSYLFIAHDLAVVEHIQAQILNLLMDLQKELGLSYLFIAHDLAVVEHISSRVAVMYLGKIVEEARSETLYENPLHPYTRALLSAVPIPDPLRKRDRILLPGDIPSPVNPPSGCRFHTRCWLAEERCKVEVPLMRQAQDGHLVACHLVDTAKAELVKDGKTIPPVPMRRLQLARPAPTPPPASAAGAT